MRKKERNGPGIATLVDSDETLASSVATVGVRPRAAAVQYAAQKRVVASMAGRAQKILAQYLTRISVKRSVRAFNVASRETESALNGSVEMHRKKIWTQ
jgi:hypothetical protein